MLTLKEKYYDHQISPDESSGKDLLEQLAVTRTEKIDLGRYLSHLKSFLKKSNDKHHQNTREGDNKIASKKAPNLKKRVVALFTELTEFPDKEIGWLPFAIFQGCRIVRKTDVTCLLSTSPPHSNHIITTLLKKLTGVKLVVDFRDPWSRSVWKDQRSTLYKRFRNKIERYLEKWVVSNADKVIFVTSELKNDFIKCYPNLPSSKFHVFTNGYDPENKITDTKRIVRNSERFFFTHTGTLYKKRDPSQLIHAVKVLIERHDYLRGRIGIRFIGTISQELSHVLDLVRQLRLQEMIEFLPAVSYRKSLEYMESSNALILLQPGTHLQIPAKLYDYICFDKPILAVGQKKSAVENVIKDSLGHFVDNESIEDIINGLILLYENPDSFVQLTKKNREKYNIAKSIKILNSILEC
ncbi:MAG: glycosyltransferase [Waddliaceae bacterium]